MPSILAPDIQEDAPAISPEQLEALRALTGNSQDASLPQGNAISSQGDTYGAPAPAIQPKPAKAPAITANPSQQASHIRAHAAAQAQQFQPTAPAIQTQLQPPAAPSVLSETAPLNRVPTQPTSNGPQTPGIQSYTPTDLGAFKAPNLPGNNAPAIPVPGLSALQHKISDQPGKQGIGGHILRALEHGGVGILQGLQAYGDARFPRLMAEIPGTPVHNEVQQARKQQSQELSQETELKRAQTEQARAAASKDLNPQLNLSDIQANMYKQLVAGGMDPVKALQEVQRPPSAGAQKAYNYNGSVIYVPGNQAPPPGATPFQKPPAQGSKQVQGVLNGKPYWAWTVPGGKRGFTDENGTPLNGFTPAPSYAEVAPEMQEQRLEAQHVTMLGPNGEQEIFTYDPQTKHYTNAQGEAVSGAQGSRVLQAGTVIGAGQDLIDYIKAHPELAGNFEKYAQAAALGTPLSSPEETLLASKIASFAALNPAMHGFRSMEALKAFQQLMGGITNNPNSIISGVQGIMQTAQVLNPNAGQHPTGGPRANTKLTPPSASKLGFKWQHRTVNGKTEWRQVKAQ